MIAFLTRSAPARWAALIALSALLAVTMGALHIPAGWMMGPMFAAIALAVKGIEMHTPRLPFAASQALIGCLIASSLGPAILPQLARDWPLFVAMAMGTLMVSFAIGAVLARLKVLPGAVAIWGSAPGLATAMVLMARDSGADYRLVAFMTYLRMLMVALGATGLSLVLHAGHANTAAASHQALFGPVPLVAALSTLGIALGGALIGRAVRLPAADILGPLVLGTALHVSGLVPQLVLPGALLNCAYMIVGWGIGARFTPQTISQARSALPYVFISVLAMILGCFALGLLLSWIAHVDIATAYLATSPGGMAAIAVIAASTPVNVAFVLTLQTTRMAAILLFGPPIARAVARRFA